MLGKLSGEEEPHRGLDLTGGDGRPLVVVGKTGGLGGDALEDVVDEGVHDGHSLGADASVGVDLLEDLVDVDRVRFLPLLAFLLAISLGDGLGGLAGLFGSFSGGLGWHVVGDSMWGRSVDQRIYMRLEDQAFSRRPFMHPDW